MQATINPGNSVPLYRQLYAIVRDEIAHKKWKPGELIPPESALMKEFGVSRITVRQVFDLLVKDGLIYRERGRGTYIAEPRLEHGLDRITGFTEQMALRGRTPGARVLHTGTVAVSKDTAEALRMEPGADAMMIKRLRTADGEPICVEQVLFSPARCPGLLDEDLADRSLHDILREKYDIRLARARQKIQAVAAAADLAGQLELAPGEPLLFIERTGYDEQDEPVEFLMTWYRADRFQLYGELKG